MRLLAVLALVGACSFEHGTLGSAADGGVDTTDTGPDRWVYRKPVTILGSHVRNGAHIRFVALIAWDVDDALAKHARADGHDIRFVTTDGVKMPYERVAYNGATGGLQAWVQVPSIQQSQDTPFFIEYGNPNASDQQDAAATWPPNVVGAWHLESGDDSTGNNNDAQAVNGAMIGVKAKVGLGASLDGIDDRLLMPNSASLDAVATQGTISLWLKLTDATAVTRQFIMASSNDITPPKSSFEWAVSTSGDTYFYPRRGDGDVAFNSITNPFTDGRWHHAAVRLQFSSKAVEFFIDGMQTTLTTNNAATMWMMLADPDDWLWGSHPLYAAPLLGAMDEIRVVTALRGSGWLATEYLNQNDPPGFIRVDPEELVP
ncbi:MAG TPA: DUF2341 domain-containing protein [Kofleriaceae bacterium]|nr:DUF2341 domain-containing protein [Kofleriaceae bacterium]